MNVANSFNRHVVADHTVTIAGVDAAMRARTDLDASHNPTTIGRFRFREA